jgi:hypothetical protein
MLATKDAPQTVDHKPHADFFRQSGWLMIASITGGVLMFFVHFLNKFIPDQDYSAFGVLLMVVACVPTLPMQMVFAQQTAKALATGNERQLARMSQGIFLLVTTLCVLIAIVVVSFRSAIVEYWHLPNATGLILTLPLLWFSVVNPMLVGMLQGRQDFFWIGWTTIINGVMRLVGAGLLVALGFGAGGMTGGVLIGFSIVVAIGIGRTRDLVFRPGEAFDWKVWRDVVPLFLGFLACQVLFTSDSMFTMSHFSGDEMKPYVLAGTLSRALLWLVQPLATVMFPKIVQSSMRGQKSNLFGLVVLGTAVLSACGMIGLWVTGPLVVRIVGKPTDVAGAMALIPWYAGAMIPLAMANVMVNDLLARSKYAIVPFAVLVAIGYCFAMPYMLSHYPGRLQIPLQTVGAFNLLLFCICAVFTWGKFGKKSDTIPA